MTDVGLMKKKIDDHGNDEIYDLVKMDERIEVFIGNLAVA